MTITKQVVRMQTDINASVGELTFTCPGLSPIVLHVGRLHKDVLAYAVLHGLKARVGDCAAASSGTSWTEKHAAMLSLVEHYESGSAEWAMRSTAARVVGADTQLLVAALMELKPGKTRDEIAAFVKVRSPEERAALIQSPAVKAIVDRLRTALSQDVDATALLEELN